MILEKINVYRVQWDAKFVLIQAIALPVSQVIQFRIISVFLDVLLENTMIM